MHPQFTPGDIARFWAKVDKNGPIPEHRPELGPCWVWTGSANKLGYGSLRFPYGLVKAHRMSYGIHKGPLPDGLFACHECDYPPCVNPDHLFAGTALDNSRDCLAKQRLPTGEHAWSHRHRELVPRGEKHPHAKLTETQVAEIRECYATGAFFQRELAARFGVSISLISGIVRGDSWAHLTVEKYPAGKYWRRRLTEDQVKNIRQRYALGGISQQALADQYGIARESVRDIIHGRRWAHLSSL